MPRLKNLLSRIKYLIRSIRENYNIKVFSWKSLFVINFITMLMFFLWFDDTSSVIHLMQVISSGAFLSILVYVVTIVIPERNRVKLIIQIINLDFSLALGAIFSGLKCNHGQLEFSLKTLFPAAIIELEANLGMITRTIGYERCIAGRRGLLSYCHYFKLKIGELAGLLEDPVGNQGKIEALQYEVIRVYNNELLPKCRLIERLYLINHSLFRLR